MEKDYITRRKFFKKTGQVTGGLVASLAIAGSLKANQQPNKNLETKTPDNKETGLTKERLKQMAENNRKYTQLSRWMDKNSDKIFEKSPNNEIYAVGIWRKEKPEIHYFNDKWKEVLPFMKKLNEKGEVNGFIYRYQSDIGMMLACG